MAYEVEKLIAAMGLEGAADLWKRHTQEIKKVIENLKICNWQELL